MRTTDSMLPAQLTRKAAEMERRAAALLDAAQKLREAAAVLSGSPTVNSGKKRPRGRPPRRAGKTRFEQLREFVESRGSVTRQEAIRESGIPRGTVGAFLTRRHGFAQDENGRWYWPKKRQNTAGQ
jgi:hypothetical protein